MIIIKLNDYFQKLNKTKAGYVEINLNSDTSIDDFQFAAVNSNSNIFFNCMRDRNSENCIFYDIKGAISLEEYILSKTFDFHSFKDLLIKVTNPIIEMKKLKLKVENVLFASSYIFVNSYDETIKFINIPIAAKNNMCDINEEFKSLLKKIISIISVENDYKLIGFILQNINSKSFSIENFCKELYLINPVKDDDNSKSFLRKSMKNFYIIFLSLLITVVLIPSAGVLFHVKIISDYVDNMSLIIFTSLFFIGSLFSFIITILINKNKSNKKSNNIESVEYSFKSFEKNSTEKSNDSVSRHITDSGNISISSNIEDKKVEIQLLLVKKNIIQ